MGAYTHVRETASLRSSRFDPGRAAIAIGWGVLYIVAFYIGLEEAFRGTFGQPPFDNGPILWGSIENFWLALYPLPLVVITALSFGRIRYIRRIASETSAATAQLLRCGADPR